MKPRIDATTDPAHWPVLLTAAEVALVLGRSYSRVLRACEESRMDPPPITDRQGDYKRPYRWNRDRVRRYVDHEAVQPTGLRRVS